MSDYNNALAYSSQWLDIIKQENFPEETQARWIIEESKQNFAEHFNRGWLEYRKSVTEAGDWASVEWSGKGSTFTDVMGRKYIDWLGGFGMMDLGWCHPEVVEAVIAQVKRSPMPSQELIDPLRGVLAKLMSEITPGDLKYSWFAASGTEAIEASIKIAKLYTGKIGIYCCPERLSWQDDGLTLDDGQGRLPPAHGYVVWRTGLSCPVWGCGGRGKTA